MWSIDDSTGKIVLTKQDTPSFKVTCNKQSDDGTIEEYTPEEDDEFTFAVKKNKTDSGYLFKINIPNDTMVVQFDSENTKDLEVGKYFYDVQLKKSDGFRDTFLSGILMLTMEVYDG